MQLEYQDIEPPKASEVLVRMIARPINPSDILPVNGSYANRISLPYTPGYEGVGIVEDVGSSVRQSILGKRVLSLRGEGTWQDFVKVPAPFAIPVPNSISDATAAQLYINPVTALVTIMEKLQLNAGQTLLVNACGSMIGHLYAQLANVVGFRLIAVTRNLKHSQDLLELGATAVIDTSRYPLYETVMDLTNGLRADAAIDSIGGQEAVDLAGCLQSNGSFISIGLLSGIPIDWQALRRDIRADLFHLRHWNQQVTDHRWHDTLQQIVQLTAKKRLQLLPVKASFPLKSIDKALLAALDGRKGKVLLTS
ncbi:zinc-dependent alcohol dehydrogenase family protein [Gracilibacillus phocaeensis]|uniref:zinc-dependent alcohol dehydrogenase family protein n=1 Tax=Gracilibacillus phocaeensis TaxID=2042304 RepID=UPI002570B5FE|nr:zinc-dependent alcohol dehydrogenase family protein [Gracilibacillus phocaeensis]